MQGMTNIAIVNMNLGNLFSVHLACTKIGMNPVLVTFPEQIHLCDAILIPGVGAFGSAMRVLKESGMIDAIKYEAANDTPIIGICLGMQLLMDKSYEHGECDGLSFIHGDVTRLPVTTINHRMLKVPEIGWNRVSLKKSFPLMKDDEYYYFNHSYYVKPDDNKDIAATTTYGITYCSVVHHKNIVGFQFHPERSGENGLAIYKNISRWISGEIYI